MTENADIDKYGYSGYGIGCDRRSSFSHPSDGDGQNVIIFGVDMSSPTKTNNREVCFNSWKRPNTGIRTYAKC